MAFEPVSLRAVGFWPKVDFVIPLGALGFAAYQALHTVYWSGFVMFMGPVVAYGALRLWNLSVRKARITPVRLDYFNGFGWRGIDRADVKGWRLRSSRGGTWYHLVPKIEGAKACSIPQWLFDHPAAQSWFAGLNDVASVEAAEAQAALEADPAYGPDKAARLQRKTILQIWVILTALLIGVVFMAGAVIKWDSWFVLGVFALLPLFGFALDAAYPNQFRFAFEGGQADPRPSLLAFYGTSGFLVPFAALDALNIVDSGNLFAMALVVGAFLAAYVLWRAPLLRRSLWGWAGVTLMAFIYAAFAIAVADSYGDPGRRGMIPIAVERAYKDRGLEVTLAPWAGDHHSRDIQVTSSQFEAMKKSGRACAIVGRGLIGLRWYRLDACPPRTAGMQ